MHGVVARRTARHFGFVYDYERRGLVRDVEPISDWLLPVREKAAMLADVAPEDLTFELELAPRSGYVLAGPARTAWQHHVPPAKRLRYSITFRTLRTSGTGRRSARASGRTRTARS